ncbi:MAG: hypothetical protein D6765_11105 [Bacteroidetes bacterium]|nr:MAG: hypothetical protein D6765_11105 [Bacteroidota bacterium]
MKRYLAILGMILGLEPGPTVAQPLYEAGFVVTLDGDTLLGRIRENTFRNLSREVLFLPRGQTQPQRYTPRELQAFYIGEGRQLFERKRVQLTGETAEGQPFHYYDARFLKVLVKGELTLYEQLRQGRNRYFVEKAGGAMQPLRKIVLRQTGYSLQSMETIADTLGHLEQPGRAGLYRVDHEYLRTLKRALADCPLTQITARDRFSPHHLRKLAKVYHLCRRNPHPPSEFFPRTVQFSILGELGASSYARFEEAGVLLSAGLGVHFPSVSKQTHVEGGATLFIVGEETFRAFWMRVAQDLLFGNRSTPFFFVGFEAGNYPPSNPNDPQSLDPDRVIPRFSLGLGFRHYLNRRTRLYAYLSAPTFPAFRAGIGRRIP